MRKGLWLLSCSLSLFACNGAPSVPAGAPTEGSGGLGSGPLEDGGDGDGDSPGTGGATTMDPPSDAGAGGEAMGGAMPTENNLANLGIDPLGRGDGFDLTESSYSGACYEEDEMEANRPMLPDPRVVAEEEAQAVAEVSQQALLAAKMALDEAAQAVEDSLAERTAAAEAEDEEAGWAYVGAVTLAKDVAEDAYQEGLIALAPEKTTEWQELFEHPLDTIQEMAASFFSSPDGEVDPPFGLDLAAHVIARETKAAMLDFLEVARNETLRVYEDVTGKIGDGGERDIVADPILLAGFRQAQLDHDAAVAQAIEDADAAFAAWVFIDSESDLPPCDSEELRQTLDEAFCHEDFENPISQEDEEMFPGISERFMAYIDRVCDAVT